MSNTIRIAVVDDHPIFRTGVIKILGSDKSQVVVAEGGSAASACRIAEECRPDLMLLDVTMHDGSGIGVVADIKRRSPATRVVILTASECEDEVAAAFKAGAHGYVIKGTAASELIRAIHTVSRGETYVTPTLASRMLIRSRLSSAGEAGTTDLTPREEEVLRSVGQGMTNKEIARAFRLSEKTVKHHMTSIMSKLALRNRVEVALAAARLLAAQDKSSAQPSTR